MPRKLVSRALEQPLGITGNVSITGNLALQGNILFAYNNNNRLYGVGNILYYKTATETFTVQNTAVVPSVYGGSSKVPVFTVDSQGRLTSAANVNVAGVSGFSASGNSFTISTADGSSFIANLQQDSVRLGTDTTGSYVSSLVQGTGVTITNNSGEGATPTIAIGQAVATSSDVTFNNMTLSGNLNVLGNTTFLTSNSLTITDPLIYLAGNNYSSDLVDIGFVGNYYDGSRQRHAGLFRDASDGVFKLFANLNPEPTNIIDTANASFRYAGLYVDSLFGSNVSITGGVDYNYFTEKVINVVATSANTTIDWSTGAIFDMNLASNTTITFTNPPPAMRARTISLIVRPTGTGTRVLFVQRARYTDGVAPVLSNTGNIDMLSFMTVDGGNTYFGSFVLAGLGFPAHPF